MCAIQVRTVMNHTCQLSPGMGFLCLCHQKSLRDVLGWLLLQGDDALSIYQYQQSCSRPGIHLPTSYRLFLTDQHLTNPTGKWNKPWRESAQKLKFNLCPMHQHKRYPPTAPQVRLQRVTAHFLHHSMFQIISIQPPSVFLPLQPPALPCIPLPATTAVGKL